MTGEKRPYVCPAEFSGSLDSPVRRFFHKPGKILGGHITHGMTVLDLGCGPGYFTREIARMVGDAGKVIAADLQQGMLDKLWTRISGTGLERIIELHRCSEDSIGIIQKVDFVLAFWMVHEVPDKDRLFRELKSILKPGGKILIAEPKFHVPKQSFKSMTGIAENLGFRIIGTRGVTISRAILLAIDL